MKPRGRLCLGARLLVAGVASLLATPVAWAGAGKVPGFASTPCPGSVADVADCLSARDANGAWLLVAMPKQWNRRLVVHVHGGPRLHAPREGDGGEDLDRFSSLVRAGYAWIGTTYRRGG